MPTTIAILSHHRHPRLRYILKALSLDSGYHLRLITDQSKWENAEADAKVTYGVAVSDETIPVWLASRFLSGSAPSQQDLRVDWLEDVPRFFSGDLLACCFFALSRYEEYQPFTPDKHHRFPAKESHAMANDYLHLPVVRIWTRLLVTRLQAAFPELPPPRQWPFSFRPTYDIDLLWAYHYRGWRGIASGLRDVLTGFFGRAKARFTSPPSEDPYYTLDYLLNLHPKRKADVFWLLADKSAREDINPYPIPDKQISVMQALSSQVTMGIHPGYHSTGNKQKLSEEIKRLTDIMGKSPTHSRQHFLRLTLPETYQQLRLQGITHDHSMGYADAVGWRAGTNQPFYWYNLYEERSTGLTVVPFAAMDVTLKNYLGLSPEEAREKVLLLANHCQEVGGDFSLLWHNSSFSEDHGWEGWKTGYEELVVALVSKEPLAT